MPRFLSIVRIDESTATPPSETLATAMGALMEEMTSRGVLLDTAGLRPTAEGVRIRNRHGEISRVDGPFTESKEVVAGYALLEAASLAEAVAHTRRFLEVHGDGWNLECEVRQLDGCDREAPTAGLG